MINIDKLELIASTKPSPSMACGDPTFQTFYFKDSRTNRIYEQTQSGEIGEKPRLKPYIGILNATQLKEFVPRTVGFGLEWAEQRIKFTF